MGNRPERKGFASFDALKRATQGEQDAPEETAAPKEDAADKGWTLESQEGDEVELTEEELAALPDIGPEVPARIANRPHAFGPMDHGPPPYRDDGSDEMVVLKGFRVRTQFPEDVLAEVGGLPSDPRPADLEGRVDLRDELIFTIDGADAKDYDDAIQIAPLDGGGFTVGVHIADVGHYVRAGTALDDEALARGTSVYVADQVIPMLPEELSNGLCSLVPDRDRLAYSVYMDFDAEGARKDVRIHKSVIRSKHRCTYKAVQECLDGDDTEGAQALAHLKPTLEKFAAWTRKQQGLRDARGSLRMQSTEKKFVFDARHEVERITIAPRYFSQTLIEETALAANQAVGDAFRKRGLPTIYRVHPEKDPEEVAKLIEALEKFNIRVPKKDRLTGRDIARLITMARKRPNAEALTQRIMGLVERAVYEVHDHEDVAEHWGLAREAYLHFTSPIRRYPDLIVHRWLHAIESEREGAEDELRSDALLAELNAMATHASIQADLAEMAERAIFDLKVCQYMEPHIGAKLTARVLSVRRAGMTIDLVGHNVTGFLPTFVLGTRPKVEGPNLKVQVGKRHLSFTEGQAIDVQVKDVDFLRLQVLLELP